MDFGADNIKEAMKGGIVVGPATFVGHSNRGLLMDTWIELTWPAASGDHEAHDQARPSQQLSDD